MSETVKIYEQFTEQIPKKRAGLPDHEVDRQSGKRQFSVMDDLYQNGGQETVNFKILNSDERGVYWGLRQRGWLFIDGLGEIREITLTEKGVRNYERHLIEEGRRDELRDDTELRFDVWSVDGEWVRFEFTEGYIVGEGVFVDQIEGNLLSSVSEFVEELFPNEYDDEDENSSPTSLGQHTLDDWQ